VTNIDKVDSKLNDEEMVVVKKLEIDENPPAHVIE